jgi:hypothetical protein
MVKISKNATRNPFFILAILFAAGILYLIFRNYSFKEGQTGNDSYSVDEDGNVSDENGNPVGYVLDEEEEDNAEEEEDTTSDDTEADDQDHEDDNKKNDHATKNNRATKDTSNELTRPPRKTTTGLNAHVYHSGKIIRTVEVAK